MDKMPIGYKPGRGNPLDKKVPRNKKYENVKPTFSTGPTVRDIEVVSNSTIAKKRNELFKRIKTSTVSHLIAQEAVQESIYNLNPENDDQQFQQFDNQSQYSQKTRFTEVSQVSAITYATEQLGITDQTSFLLLDLREPEDFELFRIREAINYPAPWLSRDKILPQMLRFKNQPNKLIIIYHFDEKHGIPTATLFAEKGYENVYLISGGVEKFLRQFPEQVIGKKVPVLPKVEENPNKIIKRSNYKEKEEPINRPESKANDNKSQMSKVTRQSSLSKASSSQKQQQPQQQQQN